MWTNREWIVHYAEVIRFDGVSPMSEFWRRGPQTAFEEIEPAAGVRFLSAFPPTRDFEGAFTAGVCLVCRFTVMAVVQTRHPGDVEASRSNLYDGQDKHVARDQSITPAQSR